MSCSLCESVITGRRPGISCDGFCKKQYHISCCGLSIEAVKISSIPGCLWYCKNCLTVENSGVETKRALDAVFEEMKKKLEELFTSLKNDFVKLAEQKLNYNDTPMHKSGPSYSQVVSNNKSAVIIKPKDQNKKNSDTKSEILQNINPLESKIQLNKVKNIKKGGIVVSCKNDKDTKKFKNLADEKLSGHFEIREVSNPRPRIKIVGISEKFDSESEIVHLIKSQNSALFDKDSECTVIRLWPTKKNKNISQAILQVDNITYTKVMNLNENCFFVGYDCCLVYDAINLYRCFKCSGYNHSSNSCQRKKSCPVCSLEHDLSECSPDADKKCINCLNFKGKSENNDIDYKHAAWDSECTVYKYKLAQYKSKIFGTQ